MYGVLQHSTNCSVGNITKWNTSNAADMNWFFLEASEHLQNDLRTWNVNKVVTHNDFGIYQNKNGVYRDIPGVRDPHWVS